MANISSSVQLWQWKQPLLRKLPNCLLIPQQITRWNIMKSVGGHEMSSRHLLIVSNTRTHCPCQAIKKRLPVFSMETNANALLLASFILIQWLMHDLMHEWFQFVRIYWRLKKKIVLQCKNMLISLPCWIVT